MKLFFGFIAATLLSLSAQAQAVENRDSLEIVLKNLPAEERLQLYVELCTGKASSRKTAQNTLYFVPDAIALATALDKPYEQLWLRIEQAEALGLLKSRGMAIDSLHNLLPDVYALNNERLIFNSLSVLGNQYIEVDSLARANETYRKTLDLAREMADVRFMAIAYNNLGNVSNHLGRSLKAIEYYTNSIQLKESLGDKSIAGTYNNVSQIYKNIGEFEESLVFNRKAMRLQKETDNKFGLSISCLNMGNTFRKLGRYDSALIYNEEALRISESIADTLGFAFAYYNLASVYFSKKEYQESITYYNKAARIFEKYGMRSNTAQAWLGSSSCYRMLKNFEQAMLSANEAKRIAARLSSYSLHQELAETLYELYKATGKYKLALDYHELYKVYSDSILNDTKVKEIGNIKRDYEVANRDNQIALLNSEKNLADLQLKQESSLRNWLIVVIGLVVLIIIIIYGRYRLKTRAEAELALKNKELEALNTAKDKFFAIIAHDLRNPLSAFKMLTAGLKENISHFSEQEIEEQLANLAESSSHLTELLHNLLQWALSQTESLNMNPQTVNLREMLDENVRLIEDLARRKNIAVSINVDRRLSSTLDQNSMNLVFRNLLTNATKFTKPNGKIKVESAVEDEYIKVSIADDGIGIAKEEQGLLFDLTKDSTKVGSSLNKGTGLGLILCKEFVNKNNGRIELESELGKGSTFNVFLPRKLKTSA